MSKRCCVALAGVACRMPCLCQFCYDASFGRACSSVGSAIATAAAPCELLLDWCEALLQLDCMADIN